MWASEDQLNGIVLFRVLRNGINFCLDQSKQDMVDQIHSIS
jgi:hypothetical protein